MNAVSLALSWHVRCVKRTESSSPHSGKHYIVKHLVLRHRQLDIL